MCKSRLIPRRSCFVPIYGMWTFFSFCEMLSIRKQFRIINLSLKEQFIELNNNFFFCDRWSFAHLLSLSSRNVSSRVLFSSLSRLQLKSHMKLQFEENNAIFSRPRFHGVTVAATTATFNDSWNNRISKLSISASRPPLASCRVRSARSRVRACVSLFRSRTAFSFPFFPRATYTRDRVPSADRDARYFARRLSLGEQCRKIT